MPPARKSRKVEADADDEEQESSEPVKKPVFVPKDAMQWVFIVTDGIVQHDPNTENEPALCALRHPRSNSKSLFVFSNDNKSIHEVVQFKEEFRSWFIGETVQNDGSIYMTTPVDPVFLVLPYLIKSAESGKFMTLDQMLVDEEYSNCHRLQCCCLQDELENVSDTKGSDDLRAYRYNKDKTLSWLKLKTEAVSGVLERRRVCVSGAKTSDLVQSKASQEEYMRYAFGVVSDYLPSDLSSSLREFLGIPAVVEKRPSDAQNPPSKRAKLGDITPSEDYSLNVKPDDKANKGKVTAAQKKLEKVDKSGMKSMMSFFSPKAKT